MIRCEEVLKLRSLGASPLWYHVTGFNGCLAGAWSLSPDGPVIDGVPTGPSVHGLQRKRQAEYNHPLADFHETL